MDNIVVRQMTIDDISQVVEIENESFSSPWTEKGFKESLELLYSKFYVAIINSEIVGYVGTYLMYDDIDITNVAVREQHRRKGVANKLIDMVIEYAKEKDASCINLEVRPSNMSARNLYKKFGFDEIGVRKNFYSKPVEDGIIMQKHLK